VNFCQQIYKTPYYTCAKFHNCKSYACLKNSSEFDKINTANTGPTTSVTTGIYTDATASA
jgi:hypothetical protein